ncbi:MAG: phosphate-starvation-inducible PsiE family protein [Nitrospirae bacterium]|nr:phosphate-starvation-inducible PsiE family protein [Nitrospirota bacterium]
MNTLEPETQKPNQVINFLCRWLSYFDDVLLTLVAVGIVVLAVILLFEAYSDFYYFYEHSIPHIISDLMFVLILMELFRQVIRQLKRHTFTLSPFLFIGVIASIRGILIIQMKLALGLAEGWITLAQIGIYAVIVFIMVISYYFSSKIERGDSQ